MVGEWKSTILGDVVTLKRGYDLPGHQRVPGSVPIVSSSGITDRHLQPMVKGPGVVTGRYGTLGQVFFIPEDFWPLNTTLYVSDFKGNDPRFISYLLTRVDFFAYSDKAAVPGLNRNHLHQAEVRIPVDVYEQRAIAYILGTLDDKIELNRKMNETLDAMARALFKSWFADFDPVRAKAEGRDTGLPAHIADLFPDSLEDSELGEIPRGWKVVVLDELADLILGGDWGEDAPTAEKSEPARCIRGADIPSLQAGGIGKMPLRYLKASSLEKRQLNDGDLVVEISGGSPTQSTGRPVLISNGLLHRLDAPLICSNFCRLLKLKAPVASKFVYLWLRLLYTNDEFLQYENGTTGIKSFAFTLFSSKYKLCVPPTEMLKTFDQRVTDLFGRQQANAVESDSLSSIRDTLLPKLISGELRVKDAERLVQRLL